MINEDLNNLVSNVLSENSYSNCRLCLKEIPGNCVRLEDNVSLHSEKESFLPLSEVLAKLFGVEICEEISGLDAVCISCVDKALESYSFIKTCERSTKLLYNIFDNLTDVLKAEIDITDKHDRLYVIVSEDESRIILSSKVKEEKKSPNVKRKHTQYTCDECHVIFGNIEELRAHNLTIHGTVTCDMCCQTFASETEFELHTSSSHTFSCPDCPQSHNSEESLNKHQDKAHTIYICTDCGKSCRGLDKLRAHEEKHITKSLCPKCGKTYITKDFFIRHVKLCLEDRIDPHPYRAKITKTFFCNKCGKGYSTSGGLRVHDRFVHGDAKPHICEHCGKKFTAPSYLKIHLVKHTGEKNFKCTICGNNFVSKEALLYHTRRHTGEKPYFCKLCSEKFVNASARAEHIKFKHSGPKLTCEICSRKFYTANFLRQHVSRHHDPSSKLYTGRSMVLPNEPDEKNMRCKVEDWTNEEI